MCTINLLYKLLCWCVEIHCINRCVVKWSTRPDNVLSSLYCYSSQFDCIYDSDHWWDKALDWSCDAGISDKLMEAVTMEMNTIPSHAQVVVRTTGGLQYLLLEEVDKLMVNIMNLCLFSP